MYTLSVELHGLRQLERLQPDLVADVRRRTIATVEVHGGSFALQHSGLWVFRFERAQPDDRQGVLDALSQTTALLAERESELAGWGIHLDYLEEAVAEAARGVHEALLPTCEDNTVWLGPTAHSLLGEYVETDQPEAGSTLYRVTGRPGGGPGEVGSVLEFARDERSTDAILDAFVPDELAGGMLLVVGDDPVALRANVRAALELLAGSSPSVRWLEAEPDCEQRYAPLASAFTPFDVHETRFWLTGPARGSWEERAPLVTATLARDYSSVLPDSGETDLLIALESYLYAYVMRAAAAVVPPVLVCHDLDRWPDAAVDALARLVGRLPVSPTRPALILVATASRSLGSSSVAHLVRTTVRLARRTRGEVRSDSPSGVNWDRLMRLTHGRSAPVVHYLADHRHWDALTDGELDGVGEDDIAWRVVAMQDSELKEALLAAHYAGPFVSREQFTEIVVGLGTERVRVPALLTRLRLHGFVVDRDRVVPVHRSHRARLEAALGHASRAVYESVATALLRLAEAGRVELSEALAALLAGLDRGRHLPLLHHRLLSRMMSCRRFAEAHRLLYDVVPTRADDANARACMQAVVGANRLRLALLRGNTQAARRTRAASERIAPAERCDFATGDLAVQKARLSFQDRPAKETVALLKRAIMTYQELDDQAGLARANLDFGLVLLAQEDLLGAREYFLLARRSAANDQDLFEQIRARVSMLACDFVYGNLTQSRAQAGELDELAGAGGMREVQLFAELARGRVAFELGRYDEAADCFSRGRSRGRLYGHGRARAVMERWLARSLVYDGRVRRGYRILQDLADDPETAFFAAEALQRLGEHGGAIAALEGGLAEVSAETAALESIGWSSGYAPLEDRAIGVTGGTRVLTHQMMALRGYLLAESGATAEGVEEMHRLTRELRISEVDPYNRVYFYLYSVILPESGDLSVEDGTTVLGKAVRYIQQRTSRMDAYADKTDFLRRNYWNARLMSHAQSHNLV